MLDATYRSGVCLHEAGSLTQDKDKEKISMKIMEKQQDMQDETTSTKVCVSALGGVREDSVEGEMAKLIPT